MSFFLAIDAGGTKTQCLLADETHVLARASVGTVKLMHVSEAEATARLQKMLSDLSTAAGVSLARITRTCFGLAGLSSPSVRAWAERVVGALVAGDLLLCGDEEIALDAAFGAGPGILVVAGTGSNAIGRTSTGEIVSAGGWGPVLGDEGSGMWIGLEAIRAVLAARDRGPSRCLGRESSRRQNYSSSVGDSHSLLDEIARHWRVDSLGELVAYANRRGDAHSAAPDFASLAPLVARCAEQADALASDVLYRAGNELAVLVAQVGQKMLLSAAQISKCVDSNAPDFSSTPEIEVAYTGSVLAQIAAVRKAMTACLTVLLPSARVREYAVNPLDGALWRARLSYSLPCNRAEESITV
jgi:N-acetylglucosamine kinase-like BadF-type ATPase